MTSNGDTDNLNFLIENSTLKPQKENKVNHSIADSEIYSSTNGEYDSDYQGEALIEESDFNSLSFLPTNLSTNSLMEIAYKEPIDYINEVIQFPSTILEKEPEIGDLVVYSIIAGIIGNGNIRVVKLRDFKGWVSVLQTSGKSNSKINDHNLQAWVMEKDSLKKKIVLSNEQFGRAAPSASEQNRYLAAVMEVHKMLKIFLNSGSIEQFNSLESLYELKGLYSRSVKKDRWDWLYAFKALGFEDDKDAVNNRNAYIDFQMKLKLFQKSNQQDIEISEVIRSLYTLLEMDTVKKLEQAIEFIEKNGRDNWETINGKKLLIRKKGEGKQS